MSDIVLNDPIELTEAELDCVSAGAAGALGLVAVAVSVSHTLNDIQIANHALENSLDNNHVNVFVPIVL